ncbi:glycosyltransferase involved in cell wall biogenesis [Streptococcus pneumoniae]|nr:glycosyltransferase involved in cell wall biogenesis [Streptococcus pneumoniae]VLV88914.1 glycosyltransferase involved in cell wall biogenesis [Streptococcus pneumoniae]
MKLLSIAISSYNAAAYLHYCVESLVIGGEQVGILIINDGSQDQTQEIAECLASKYPNIVRAIYQEINAMAVRSIVAWQRLLGAILK